MHQHLRHSPQRHPSDDLQRMVEGGQLRQDEREHITPHTNDQPSLHQSYSDRSARVTFTVISRPSRMIVTSTVSPTCVSVSR